MQNRTRHGQTEYAITTKIDLAFMTSQFAYLLLLATQTDLPCPSEFEIRRGNCV